MQGDVDVRLINAGEVLNKAKAEMFPKLAKKYPSISIALEGSNNDAKENAKIDGVGFCHWFDRGVFAVVIPIPLLCGAVCG